MTERETDSLQEVNISYMLMIIAAYARFCAATKLTGLELLSVLNLSQLSST